VTPPTPSHKKVCTSILNAAPKSGRVQAPGGRFSAGPSRGRRRQRGEYHVLHFAEGHVARGAVAIRVELGYGGEGAEGVGVCGDVELLGGRAGDSGDRLLVAHLDDAWGEPS